MGRCGEGGGGQMRTIKCYCGWTCHKQLQEADKLYKLHMRLTHKKKSNIVSMFQAGQGMNGIHSSKHGNVSYTPLVVTNTVARPMGLQNDSSIIK
jgi:hypothetical protein